MNRDRADFGLEISITDQANHIEQTSLSLPISSNAIIIDAVPESGRLVAGVEERRLRFDFSARWLAARN